MVEDKFDDTKGIIRSSMKDRWYSGQAKKGHTDKQRSVTHYTEN